MSVLVCPLCQHEIEPSALHCNIKNCSCNCNLAYAGRSMFNEKADREPSYRMTPNDPDQAQTVACDCGCGRVIPLVPWRRFEWSLYEVSCIRCSKYGLASKYPLTKGTQCPRCKDQYLVILNTHPFSVYMVNQFLDRGLPVFKYTHGGGIEKVD